MFSSQAYLRQSGMELHDSQSLVKAFGAPINGLVNSHTNRGGLHVI